MLINHLDKPDKSQQERGLEFDRDVVYRNTTLRRWPRLCAQRTRSGANTTPGCPVALYTNPSTNIYPFIRIIL